MDRKTLYYLIFAIIATFAIGQKVSYRNYRVYTMASKTNQDKAAVMKIVASSSEYLPWNIIHPMSILVPPARVIEFENAMKSANIPYKVTMNDVQSVIDNQRSKIGTLKTYDWTRYHTLDEIYNWLDSLPKKHPGIVETIIAGRTYKGRQIKGIKVSFKKGNPGVVLESGIHPNEWIAPATTTYLVNEFLTNKIPNVRKLAESYDWYVFPTLNADGYDYTFTTNRLWRKTVSPIKTLNGTCLGVDLNRNWGYNWAKAKIPNSECYSFFGGHTPFSEIEAVTFSKYIRSISNNIFAYITFHNLGQLLMFPYGYTKEHLDNYDDSLAIGNEAAAAIAKRNGKTYTAGSVGEIFNLIPGSSMDWVKGELKVQLSFVYLLRDIGQYGYLLPAEEIIPNCKEVLDSLLALFQEAKNRGYPKKNL